MTSQCVARESSTLISSLTSAAGYSSQGRRQNLISQSHLLYCLSSTAAPSAPTMPPAHYSGDSSTLASVRTTSHCTACTRSTTPLRRLCRSRRSIRRLRSAACGDLASILEPRPEILFAEKAVHRHFLRFYFHPFGLLSTPKAFTFAVSFYRHHFDSPFLLNASATLC